MKTRKQIRWMILWALSLVAVWIIAAAQIAKAGSTLPQGYLTSGEVVENDLFTTGEKVVVDGTVEGDAFVLGNQVQINGKINGSLFVIGQQVIIEGEVTGTTYVGAVSLELGSQAVLERNLYFAGVSLTTQPNSAIQRDLVTLCLSADLKGEISRDTRATIGILKLVETIINRLGGDGLLPRSDAQTGLVIAPRSIGGLVFAGFLTPLAATHPQSSIDTARLADWFADRLLDFGLLLILGAAFYWLFRQALNRTSHALGTRPLPALGFGLLALLITVNIFLVGLLVASLLFVIGLWLGNLGLWSFTLAFWGLAYSALVFVFQRFGFWLLMGQSWSSLTWRALGCWEKSPPIRRSTHSSG